MHSIYLTQLEQAKLSSNFANVNEYQVKAIVHKPWRGSDFSKRIWKNYTEVLPNELGDALLRGSVLGHSHEQIFKMMRQRLKDVEDYQLHRLIITEMGHVAETATADAYKEEGVEQYQYLATLESHTCEECAHLDEKVFELKDKVEGLNYPLIHPYCRCTTMPYIEGLPDVKDRWARDPETGKGYYVDNMDFETWKNAIDYQRKAQNIPNSAARCISKKGNYNWNELNAEQYNKHVKGMPEFDNYAKGRKRPVSELIISPAETQALIGKYGKKRQNTDKQKVLFNHNSYIGLWADINGNYYPTKQGRIGYSKRGCHVTPQKPDYLK